MGSHREKIGTRRVKNPDKRWWKFFTPTYIEENVYETVDDYKEEDVYTTVLDYETVIKDIWETKTEVIEKFNTPIAKIQNALFPPLRRNLDEGIAEALKYAKEQISVIKKQFSVQFDELDKLIAAKYAELERCGMDEKVKQESLQKNQKILRWIETNIAEINGILDL